MPCLQGGFLPKEIATVQPPLVFSNLFFAFIILYLLEEVNELLELSALRRDDCSSAFPSTEQQGQGNTACLHDFITVSNEHAIICVNTES